jgi:hypothetical protein
MYAWVTRLCAVGGWSADDLFVGKGMCLVRELGAVILHAQFDERGGRTSFPTPITGHFQPFPHREKRAAQVQ